MQVFHQLIETQAGLSVAFLLSAVAVILAGIRLSIYGDALGDRTGLGNGLIGLVFLAGVTSLPELVVSLTSVINVTDPFQGADLATGNMLGSNVFNLLILAFMSLIFTRRFKPETIADPHTDTALYGLIMLALFSGAYLGADRNAALIPGLDCSWMLLALPLTYALILRREHRQHQKNETGRLPGETALTRLSAARFYSGLAALSGIILGGGILLSMFGARMALPPEQGGFGLEASLIGTVFLAVSTSLPELVISFSSIRLGFPDMAIGNVLGSNMFNLLIIFVADIALRGGSLLQYASKKHWTSVGMILVLTLLSGILLRTKSRILSTITALGMIGLYIFALAVLM
jgi:cation:H+ antiporter